MFFKPVVADDHQALIWDIQQMPRAIEDPILAYTAEGEINNVQWASTQPDWIAICYNNCLEILRVWLYLFHPNTPQIPIGSIPESRIFIHL